MGDIEETIFQRNVPGKYSKWDPDDSDYLPPKYNHTNKCTEQDNAQDTEKDLFNFAQDLHNAEVPESIRQSILADRVGKSLTGVKGVLADYNASMKFERAQIEADALFRLQVLNRIAEGPKASVFSNSSAELEENNKMHPSNDNNIDSDGDFDSNNFMREFRAKRLKELKALSVVRPSFGFVHEITADTFLKEIDEEDKNVFILVHLYEPSIQTCLRMNSILDEIAMQAITVKFIKMQASFNAIEIDPIAMPILSIYRSGQQIHTIAGIVSDFGLYFTKNDVIWLLESAIEQKGFFG